MLATVEGVKPQGPAKSVGAPLLDRRLDIREPTRFELEDHFKMFLREAVTHKVSDVFLQPGEPILVEIHDRLYALTKRKLDYHEIETIAVWATGQKDVVAQLAQGKTRDASYEVFDPAAIDGRGEKVRYRFRVNATAHDNRGHMGIQVVMRYIMSDPPSVETLDLVPEILENCTPRDGIIYVTGKTGSGKTTTFAGMMRYIAENETPVRGNIVTGEAPIEFKFDKLPRTHSIFLQSEIGRHFPSFADFVRANMRRKPGLIMVGEARDQETIEASIEASLTGHPVWTTVHANSVAATFRRLVSRINKEQQAAVLFDLITTARLVVSQTLVPRVGGGRYPLREYLVINDALREELYNVKEPDRISSAVQDAVEKYGRTMLSVAKEALDKKLIPDEAYRMIAKQAGKA